MALSKKGILGLAAVAALALFGFGASAKADDGDEPDDEPPEPGPNPLDNVPDAPLPPPPPQCNYSGCGPAFDGNHASPSYYALRLQQLGYPIDVAVVSANQSTIAVQPQRGYVALFQGHFNSLRKNTEGFPPTIAAQLAPIKNSPKLDVDGLFGNHTINAENLAHAAVLLTGIKWEDLIRIVEGS